MDMSKQTDILDLKKVWELLWQKRKQYLYTMGVVFLLASALIVCVPRYYSATVSMAPEMGAATTGGTLGSIASSLGFDLGEMQTSDAISPLLYPEVISSNDFVATLLDIQTTTIDGQCRSSYFDHISIHYQVPFWTKLKGKVLGSIKKIFDDKKEPKKKGAIDPFHLTEREAGIFGRIKESILCTVNKKTGVITISVRDQDPLVAAMMADSVQARLQDHITKYRTSKARIDVEHYEELVKQSKEDYDKAVSQYSEYCDKHTNIIMQTYISDRDKLENEMQSRLSTYSAMTNQLEAAKAKLQERTPAFTILQSPTVPVKPAGPKRMIFVLGMMILATLAFAIWTSRKELLKAFDQQA